MEKVTEGLIMVEPWDVEKLMRDDLFVRNKEVCRDPKATGYYIGNYCLCDVVMKELVYKQVKGEK